MSRRVHHRDEGFYVLEGRLTFYGGETPIHTGTFVLPYAWGTQRHIDRAVQEVFSYMGPIR